MAYLGCVEIITDEAMIISPAEGRGFSEGCVFWGRP